MTRELRRFAVVDKCGAKYTVVERGTFATTKGGDVQCGASSYSTCTGWTVATTDIPNQYWIERLRLSVRAC